MNSAVSSDPTSKKTSDADAIAKSVEGKSWFKCRPVGVGACAGQQTVPNKAFEALVDTNDAWIKKRTGIAKRHLLAEGVGLRDIAVASAQEALLNSKVAPEDIDLVIVATSSPDDLFGDAASVASAIGATNAAAFDLTAACSGFVFGMVTASQFLQSGTYKKVLLVGADALSRFLDWSDRGTCILFGDGAGAVVLEATETKEASGLLGFALHSNGKGYSNLKVPFQSKYIEVQNEEHTKIDQGEYQKMTMNGPEVYKFAVHEVPLVVKEALTNAGLTSNDVDWLLLHQANVRIMEHAAKELNIPMDKVLKNIEEYGNTSAGSIPLALTEAVRAGKIKPGDVIAISGFGAGLSWGAAIIRWSG